MENIDLLRKITWSFHKTTGLEWDDLFQEAALAYLEHLEKYDPNKGKITTYMWPIISSHLKNFVKRWNKSYEYLYLSKDEIDFDTFPSHPTSSFEFLINDDEIEPIREQVKRKLIKQLREYGWRFKMIWYVLN